MSKELLRQNIMILKELVTKYETAEDKKVIRDHLAHLQAVISKQIHEERKNV